MTSAMAHVAPTTPGGAGAGAVPQPTRSRSLTPYLLLIPGVLWLSVFFVWPM